MFALLNARRGRRWFGSMAAQLAEGIMARNRTALSRAITLMESTHPEHQAEAKQLLSRVVSRSTTMDADSRATSIRIGIAGPPGAGKSTLIETLGLHVVRSGHKVAVLAIDPSSVRSGGSILGDKTRMTELSNHKDAYVRPSPSRGTLGGIALHTNEVILLCEGAGYDVVLVETVGVGQSEVTVTDVVDCVVLVLPPAAGDELQGVKKGIMEVADVVVVNKADGSLEPLAKQARSEIRSALQFLRPKYPQWSPQVLLCSAKENRNIGTIWDVVKQFKATREADGSLFEQRGVQNKTRMWSYLQDEIMRRIRDSLNSSHKEDLLGAKLHEMERDLMDGTTTPRVAAMEVAETLVPLRRHMHLHAQEITDSNKTH
eukprot:GILJ01007618.1.p1 GENE.GILJ01007618.1~~GILJ01007618.1.p1  ORF type:complete len:373 (+),score=52.63 GILJ01007618.1:158-1276(+)